MPASASAPAPAPPAVRSGDRIRVAFCIDNMGVGGTELNAVRVAERLDRDRFDLSVVALRPEGPLASRYAAAGIPVRSFPIRTLVAPATLAQARRFARFLRAQRIDVVHSHDMYNNVFATLAARLAGTPTVIASKRWGRPETKYWASNALAFRFATHVLANSESVAQALRAEDHVPADRIRVVPNFVDDAAFEPMTPADREGWRARLGIPGDALVAGVVARLHPIKDHASLVRAAAALRERWPALRVVLVGDGPEQPAVEQLVRDLGVADVVHCVGYLPQHPNPHHLFDVSVLPSLSEGFPNSLVEAMAAGRPVVATRVGGVPDAVADGVTGLLVPPATPASLAAALAELLADPARRAAMGAAGSARARALFHAGTVIPLLEAMYTSAPARRVS